MSTFQIVYLRSGLGTANFLARNGQIQRRQVVRAAGAGHAFIFGPDIVTHKSFIGPT